jgi:hypothetical protein
MFGSLGGRSSYGSERDRVSLRNCFEAFTKEEDLSNTV